MLVITAGAMLHFQRLNEVIRETKEKEITVNDCLGQRYIGAGIGDKIITVNGTPGNALGAYLNGAQIFVNGNAQDATGDTMNAGKIVISGNGGDALGFAMRGGRIYTGGDAGYRVGIHMKAYQDNKPVVVIGGKVGSFLGEYQAGGIIIVLGLTENEKDVAGNFCGTGMHGGQIYLRTDKLPNLLPKQVKAEKLYGVSDPEIKDVIADYCRLYSLSEKEILDHTFYKLTPDTDNPYKQMYTNN
ncbi:MAG: glutamate synthase [Clostridia bacterium]|nr:glutamate synthase [Clostridia bacterium]